MHESLARLVARPIAHRGLHACGGIGPVENSIGAALAAVAAGYGIECDVQLSRDGEAMVFHDDELARLTGVGGRVGDLDAMALSRLVLGAGPDRIPTLATFLTFIDGQTPLVIEIKGMDDGDMRLTDRTLAFVAAYDGPIAVESFDPAVILRCREIGATCPVGLVGPIEGGVPPDPAALDASDFLSWSIAHLAEVPACTPTLPLTSWTVRSSEQAALAARHGAQIVFEGFAPETFR